MNENFDSSQVKEKFNKPSDYSDYMASVRYVDYLAERIKLLEKMELISPPYVKELEERIKKLEEKQQNLWPKLGGEIDPLREKIKKLEELAQKKPELSYSPEGVKIYFESIINPILDRIKELEEKTLQDYIKNKQVLSDTNSNDSFEILPQFKVGESPINKGSKTTGLSFEEALKASREGKKVRREIWLDNKTLFECSVKELSATDWEVVE